MLCMVLSLFACNRDEKPLEPFNARVKLLQELRTSVQQESFLIDFRSRAHRERYLLRGWMEQPDDTFVWANSTTSSVLFHAGELTRDIAATILCRTMPSADGRPQRTNVFLNDTEIGTFAVEAQEFKPYTVMLPASALRLGPNVLEFRFAYTTQPKQIEPQSRDRRKLSVAFRNILFTKAVPSEYTHDATQAIDFRAEADPAPALIFGWDSPEKNSTWAIAQTSAVVFYSYTRQHDVTVDIVCHTLPSNDQQEQQVNVAVNDVRIGAFVANPEAFQTHSVTIPADVLQIGPNRVEFQFSYRSRPAEVLSDNKDHRQLSVAFQTLTFHQNSSINDFDETALLQYAGSTVSMVAKLPTQFHLDIQYTSVHNAVSRIQFVNADNERIEVKLSSRRKTYSKMVELGKAGVYTVRVMTEGKPESYTLWKYAQADFHESAPAHAAQRGEQGFSKVTKPDILLYVVDTLRADHLGSYGYARNTSPRFDRFAEENALFLNTYTGASWTKPGAASILTGLLPKNHHVMTREEVLQDDLMILPEILQQNGYYTAGFVTNINLTRPFGFEQGYDLYKEFPTNLPVTKTVMADVVNEEVFGFLDTYLAGEDRQPLFLLVWTMDPHGPYTPPERVRHLFDIEQYEPVGMDLIHPIQLRSVDVTPSQIEYLKTLYDQEIYFNDAEFGRLLDKMKALDIYDDASIVFMSDHGEEFYEHGSLGHGYTLYNEQLRIPLAIKAAQIPTGIHEERVQYTDIYPTILDMLGIDFPYALDGISIMRRAEADRNLYFQEHLYGNDLTAVLGSEKKIIFNRKYRKPWPPQQIPIFEAFTLDDRLDQAPLTLSGMDDAFQVQQLFSFINQGSSLNLQGTSIELDQELDERLKDLGYVK